MNNKLLHTPEGVRDIYNEEFEKKLLLQDELHTVLKLYGYKDIQTPTFEFFDIFSSERGSIPSKEMFKFFDREGNTLVLRPDFTPSIARSAAKYFKEEEMPIRLCYMGNTFINNSAYQGRLKETTQLGAELIGDRSVDADGEMIALVIDVLRKSGLKDFQVEIGQVDFFKGLIEEAGIKEDEEESLRELISNKNFFGVESLVSRQEISEELKAIFLKLPELFGDVQILGDAKKLTSNVRAIKAIERLEKLYQVLCYYGLEKYISFDLGMLSKYKYYTGIIFNAYTYGTGDAIVTGGRYDNLIKQFGKKAGSVGFAVVVDQLMLALSRQGISIPIEDNNSLLLYNSESKKIAIEYANLYRQLGMKILLFEKNENFTREEYIEYAKRNHIKKILSFENEMTVINLTIETSEEEEISLGELVRRINK